jgi:phage-related protein
LKIAKFIGNTLEIIRQFPPEAKRLAGHAIDNVQQGEMPDDWKPMATVGQGVYEIRIKTDLPKEQYRVFYVAKFEDAIYILHAFQKKTQQTAQRDIEAGRRAYQQVLEEQKK